MSSKTKISLYLDTIVVAYFKKLSKHYGIGYQTFINTALRESALNNWVDPFYRNRAGPLLPRKSRHRPDPWDLGAIDETLKP